MPTPRSNRAPPPLLAAALTAACLLGACAHNPWPAAYTPAAPRPAGSSAASATGTSPEGAGRVALELVEFEDATADRPEPGMRRIGFANFVGLYSADIEEDLRAHARSLGATRVAWGLRHMHTEHDTHLRPVHDVWTSTRHGKRYDPSTGKYADRDEKVTRSRTRYVPEVYENVYYAFRAVYYTDDEQAGGEPGTAEPER